MKKRLALTMGDPGGVGPEIIIKALLSPEAEGCCDAVVIGDSFIMEEAVALLNLPLTVRAVSSPWEIEPLSGTVRVLHLDSPSRFARCKPSAEGGAACAGYIKKAVELAMAGKVDGIVTAPISKEALRMAGLKWPGHTEMLAELTGTSDYAMVLVGGPLRVILVTIHTALGNVPSMISRERVRKTIDLSARACRMLGIAKPRIAVAGLNPHAGEGGLFGREEILEISPAVEDARKAGLEVNGPFPPDTVFHRAYNGEFDIVVCMYHDQGLIPLKMLAFDRGVNVTVGLPFVRTSPDHGTAYDIAWKGIASPASMVEAIKLASVMNAR